MLVDKRTGRIYYTVADISRRWGISPVGVRTRHDLPFRRARHNTVVAAEDLAAYEEQLRARIRDRIATLQAMLEALEEPLETSYTGKSR